MENKIRFGFDQMSPSRLMRVLRTVSTKLAGNRIFTHPPVPVATLRIRLSQLRGVLVGAAKGDPYAVKMRGTVLGSVRRLLKKEAEYVRVVSNNDVALIAQSGFVPEPTPAVPYRAIQPQGYTNSATCFPGLLDPEGNLTIGLDV
jgi:hypothetical protein